MKLFRKPAHVVVSTTYEFSPQPDITAYELALIVKNVSAYPLAARAIQATLDRPIPENLVRHFRTLATAVLLSFLAGCTPQENEAEQSAKAGFPGWMCPGDHYAMVWHNPRAAGQWVVGKSLPSDRPVCVPWTEARQVP